MDWELTSLIIQSIGASQSIAWAFLLLSNPKIRPHGIWVGLLFLLFGLRVIKSVIYIHANPAPEWIYNLGFAFHLFIGPVMAMYFYRVLSGKPMSLQVLHLLPGILILALSPIITLGNFWYLGGYAALLFQSILYLGFCAYWLIAKSHQSSQQLTGWLMMLISGFGLVLLTYFANYLLRIVDYDLAPTLFALIIFVLSFYLFRNQREVLSPQPRNKYTNLNLDDGKMETFKDRIELRYENHHDHLQSDYSLAVLSASTKIPRHILSSVFSQKLGMSFIDFTNQARIQFALKKLVNEEHLTISSIAHDSGFNSVSSFNKAFKKFTGITPSAFRDDKSKELGD